MSWEEEDLKSGGRGNVEGVGGLEISTAIEIFYSVSGHRLWTAEQSLVQVLLFPANMPKVRVACGRPGFGQPSYAM